MKVGHGDFASVQATADISSLVFGVFPDAAEPDGIGMLLVKGHAPPREIAASGSGSPVEMNAVPCTHAEHAEALRTVAGESDPQNRSMAVPAR